MVPCFPPHFIDTTCYLTLWYRPYLFLGSSRWLPCTNEASKLTGRIWKNVLPSPISAVATEMPTWGISVRDTWSRAPAGSYRANRNQKNSPLRSRLTLPLREAVCDPTTQQTPPWQWPHWLSTTSYHPSLQKWPSYIFIFMFIVCSRYLNRNATGWGTHSSYSPVFL